jgi:hypothetical protein
MAILTEDDIPIYAPSVKATGDALEGLLAYVQSICESPMAANRPLEITDKTEILQLNEFQSCFLTNHPIVSLSAVEVRSGKLRDFTGFPYSNSPWRSVELDRVSLDENELSIVTSETFWDGWNRGYLTHHGTPLFTEAKVTYATGYDFSVNSPDTIYIKSYAGQILSYLESANYKGVKRLEVPFREFQIEFTPSPINAIPDALLGAFHRFRPIDYVNY